jgi:hypothetical protein
VSRSFAVPSRALITAGHRLNRTPLSRLAIVLQEFRLSYFQNIANEADTAGSRDGFFKDEGVTVQKATKSPI